MDATAHERLGRVEALLEEVEDLEPAAARDKALELVQAIVDMYGAGLERIVAEVSERDDGTLARTFAADELIAHLLLIHDLHPVPLEERVAAALEEVRPYLESHDGGVELLGIEEGVVRLRLEGSCDGCPSSTATLKLAIEEAIHKAAPEIEAVEAEGVAPEAAPLLQLEVAPGLGGGADANGNGGGAWTTVDGLGELAAGAAEVRDVGGEPLLFLRGGRSLYAYRPSCAACGAALTAGSVADAVITCTGCGARFDARRAGRSLDDPERHLDPVPLLHDADGEVRIAAGKALAG